MRRAVVVIASSVGLVASLVAVSPAGAGTATTSADTGVFGAAFREDGFARGDTGCVSEPDGTLDCLPAGASIVSLPDGRLLYWNALEGFEDPKNAMAIEVGDTAVPDLNRILSLDPANPAASSWAATTPGDAAFVNRDPHPLPGPPTDDPDAHAVSLFCADQKLLPDGRVLAVGGTDYYQDPRIADGTGVAELEGAKTVRVFDPADNTWREAASMAYGRWYPSMLTLADGKLFVASGVSKLLKPMYPDAPAESGGNVRHSETYDVATDTWTTNVGGDRSLPLFPRLHLLPNGKVFYDAAGQTFNPAGQAYDEALWNLAAVYDPAGQGSSKWTDLGIPGIGSLAPGFRGSTFSAPLRLDPPYDTARFLTAGGVVGTTPGGFVGTDDSRISEVRMNASGGETFATFPTGPLNTKRWYPTAVPLPDGTVMAFSGADIDEVVAPGYGTPVRQAERFVPSADGRGGRWEPMASASHDRTYHNNAVLLPDGRVLVGGHAPIPNGYRKLENTPDLPVRDFSNNYHDASFEIFTPPYALRTDRPAITASPATVALGAPATIGVDDPATIDSVVLMRNPAQTHVIDGDMRSVGLTITARSATGLTVAVPANPAVLPPGPYHLFVNKKAPDGTIVPSVAAQVFIGAAAAPAYVADPAGNVTYSAAAAASAGAPAAHRPVPAGPAEPVALATRLIHGRGVDDAVAALVGLVVAVAWLNHRGRRAYSSLGRTSANRSLEK